MNTAKILSRAGLGTGTEGSVDTGPMAEALAWLKASGIRHRRTSSHQLKIGPINYWPDRGTLTIDGHGRLQNIHGLEGLKTLLAERPHDAATATATPAPLRFMPE